MKSKKLLSFTKRFDTIIEYSFYLIFITLPLGELLNSYSIGIFGFFIIIDKLILKTNLNNSPKVKTYAWILLFYFTIELFFLIFPSNHSKDYTRIEHHLILSFAPLLLLSSYLTKEKIKNGLFIFSLTVLLLGIYLEFNNIIHIYQEGYSISDVFLWRFSTYNLVGNLSIPSNYLALYACISSLIFIYNIPKGKVDYYKVGYLLIIIFLSYFILHLATRSIILIYGLILASIIPLTMIKNKLFMVSYYSILLISVIAIFSTKNYIIHKFTTSSSNFEQTIEYPRTGRWKAILENANEYWLTGVGIGNSERYLMQVYKDNGFVTAYENKYNAHNQYLQSFVEMGIIGLFSLVLMLIYPVLVALKRKDYLALSVLLVFIVFGITESFLLRQKGVVSFALLSTLFVMQKFDGKN